MGNGYFQQMQQALGIGNREERTESHQLPVDSLEKIMIDAGAIDILIDTHDQPHIDLEFQTFAEGPEMEITHESEKLQIQVTYEREFRWFGFDTQKAVLTMIVPAQVAKEWNIRATSRKVSIRNLKTASLRARISSGTLVCETIQTEKFMIQASSGTVDMKQIVADTIDASITSGFMRFARVHSDQLHAKTTSGTIQMNDVVSKMYTGECTSGEIDVNNIQSDHVTTTCSSGSVQLGDVSAEYIKSSLTSGNFRATNMQAISAHIKATSGNIKAGLHASMDDYTLEGKASSGNVVVDLPLSFDMQRENVVKGSIGNGDKYIILQTHSGDILVHVS